MIQRIQTIWLAILALLSIVLIRGGIILFDPGDGSIITLGFTGLTKEAGGIRQDLSVSYGMQIILVLIPALAVFAIFLYKKIKLQKTITLLVIAFSICLLIVTLFYWYTASQKFNGVPLPGYKMALPPVILVLAIMAYRGMVKDDRLLKSYDRLR